MRSIVNPSLRRNIKHLRLKLLAAQALAAIPGVQGPHAFAGCGFFSAAVAAKALTGAHVAATKWVRPRYPQPLLIAD
jgi:hypothetical protein